LISPGKGLVIVYTGEGKGKTTAALGLAVRAAGHGMRTFMVQFLKTGRGYGESRAPSFLPGFELYSSGRGFSWSQEVSAEEHREGIRRGWEAARAALSGERPCDLLILDELNCVFNVRDFPVADLLTPEQVVERLRARPSGMHVVITGRGAPRLFIEEADLVTEMREVKHPFREGFPATPGIEF